MCPLNNLVPFSLIAWGQTEIASGLAGILKATTPLFVVVFAHFITRDEKMSVARLGGVLLGLAGVTVSIGAELLEGLGRHAIGQLAVLGAAFSYACAGIFGRRFKDTPPLVTAAGQVTATTVLMLPLALFVDRPWTLPAIGMTTLTAILALALLSTAVAYVIYFRILASAGATAKNLCAGPIRVWTGPIRGSIYSHCWRRARELAAPPAHSRARGHPVTPQVAVLEAGAVAAARDSLPGRAAGSWSGGHGTGAVPLFVMPSCLTLWMTRKGCAGGGVRRPAAVRCRIWIFGANAHLIMPSTICAFVLGP